MKSQSNLSNPQTVNPQPSNINRKENRWKKLLASALATLGGVLFLGIGTPAFANTDSLHAQSQILKLIKLKSRCAPITGVAEADVSGRLFGLGKLRYRNSHEELYYNYTYGNDGSGVAEHLKPPAYCVSTGSPQLPDDDPGSNPPLPPKLGSAGTSQYVAQTWLPNDAGDKITVTWSADNFLQVDMTELTPGNPLSVSASIHADGGLFGSVELTAWMDDQSQPHIGTILRGVFEGMPFDLVNHPNGVVSLQFKQPLAWTVPGQVDTFFVSLQGSVNPDFPGPTQ